MSQTLTSSSHSLSPTPQTHFFYFTNSYYTSTLCIYPVPVSRIQIYTREEDVERRGDDAFMRHGDDLFSARKTSPIHHFPSNYTLIYDDLPSSSIIYLGKAFYVEILYVKGELAAPTVEMAMRQGLGGTISRYGINESSQTSSHHPQTQIFLGRQCDLSHLSDRFVARGGNINVSSSRRALIEQRHQKQERESAYTTQNQNRMRNIISALLLDSDEGEDGNLGNLTKTSSTTPSQRSSESSRNTINSINYQIKQINLSELCRSWIWRRIRPEKLYGTHEELREAYVRLRAVIHQQLDLWLQDSDDSADDDELDDTNDDMNSTLRISNEQLTKSVSRSKRVLPVARAAHQMVSHKDSLYIFGGFTGKWELADCWRYEITTKKWYCISMNTGEQGGLTERSCHQCTIHANKVYFLGRYLDPRSRSFHSVKSDFFCFDLSTHEWEVLSSDTQNDGGPPLIYEHQMCTVNDYIYVFGGRIIHSIVDPSPESSTQEWEQASSSNNEEIYSGLYSYHIYSRRWNHIQKTHNLSKQILLPMNPSTSTTKSEMVVDMRTMKPWNPSSRNSEEHSSKAVVLNHIPLHAHTGHSMVYNPKTHQLLIISSGRPRQQNTTSLMQASRRQILAYDLNSDNIFDLTATSKLAHKPAVFGSEDASFSDTAALRELSRFEKDLSGSFYGWPPFFHKLYTDDDSNAKEANPPNGVPDGPTLAPQDWFATSDAFLSSDAMDNYRVDSTHHLSVLDEQHQELHIYETIIGDASSGSSGYAHSTLWTYCLDNDAWILVQRFYPAALNSQGKVLPHPRFASQFVFNEQSQRFFLFGGNPGKASHPRSKLGDLFSWELRIPSEQSIQAVLLFFINRQLFLEMDPSKMETVEFLRDHITPLVNNMNDERYGRILGNHLHQMTTHLLREEVNRREVTAMRRNLLSLLSEMMYSSVQMHFD
mmetsp:Transcript_1328/g.4567  ORF Transcript_1328/g.4567 Transcript_1328/m.4567 type:complete len:936 (-) Transcript_1328:153-2960(-)|eukprot:CAMPEP_0117451600 /NCGR_PEP_ID=MMETSP0759-20121206/9100_1 /TAXON_ID=63605 /ORGANISM="Percolomonas cosmopolitus, Strain WS" /LENGTH=935 /DNA_ID=CAMNT_0005244223 /DNA_START=6 /DNA_END=2813 /DNA_ORIENTATION=+